MNIAIYTTQDGGSLTRRVESHTSLASALTHYIDAQTVPGIAHGIEPTREKLTGWPESEILHVGRVAIAVV